VRGGGSEEEGRVLWDATVTTVTRSRVDESDRDHHDGPGGPGELGLGPGTLVFA